MKDYNKKHWYLVHTNVEEEPYIRYKASDPDEAATFAHIDECFRLAAKTIQQTGKASQKCLQLSRSLKIKRKVQKYFRVLSIVKET